MIYNKVFLFTVIFSFSVFAQKIYHKVQQKETLYGLSKKYNISIDEIKKLNPLIENQDLSINQEIVVKNNTSNTTHLVKEKETIYGISKKYNLTVNELIQLNPILNKEELKLNQLLFISKGKLKNTQKITLNKSNSEDIHIVLMLPFNPSENKENIQKISNEFLIGSKLAIDSLSKEGKIIHLKVFDTKMNDEIITNFINEYDFKTVDAIIGPMFKKEMNLVLSLSEKSIPIFSPFSNSESLLENRNIYITKPVENSFVEKIVEDIQKNYVNEQIKIITTEKEQKSAFLIKNKFLEKYPESEIEIIFDINKLKENFQLQENKDTSTVYVLASQENKLVESSIDFLYNDLYLNQFKNFKSYSLDYLPLFDEKINLLKKMNFVYGIHQKVNLNGLSEKIILNKIKNNSCLENSKHIKYGYDVVFDVIDRMDKSGKIIDIELPKNRLSSKFEYKKENKGHINKGIKLVKLLDFKNDTF
ncbi:MAG: LysM domain-containing protein [Solirubrobacteraceae bacterium]